MDIIAMARELGKAIQQDEAYLELIRTKEANDSDEALQDMIGQFNLLATTSEYEGSKENADQAKLDEYDRQLHAMYDKIMNMPAMAAFEQAKGRIDKMMNDIVAILADAVNGGDPDTFDPDAHHECGGDCGHCHGCE